jgi:hypothetical protein
VTAWPIWRVLVWIEPWLLTVGIVHAQRPIHHAFIIPLLIAVVPASVIIAIWALARAATDVKPHGDERAWLIEMLIAGVAAMAAAGWAIAWALQARADLQQIDSMLGQSTIIIDLSLTWLSVGACVAALTLDGVLATAHEKLRQTMVWLRRTHVAVTVLHVGALIGSAWLLTQVPDSGTVENAAYFDRARGALHVYEYARATIFPVQAFFAAMAVAVVTADNYAH